MNEALIVFSRAIAGHVEDKLWSIMLFRKYVAKSKKGSIKGTKKVNVSYKQNNNIGRYFACGSLSLQSLPREIRHTIANDYYYDIDISNCHPVLLCQYAKSKKFKVQIYPIIY